MAPYFLPSNYFGQNKVPEHSLIFYSLHVNVMACENAFLLLIRECCKFVPHLNKEICHQ